MTGLVAAGFVAIAGCTGTPGHSGAAATDQADAVVIALSSEPEDFLPVVQTSVVDQVLAGNLMYPNVTEDFECKLESRPAFVKGWSWSADGKTLALDLRDDVKWQDGTPVTADDLAFAWELAADPAVQSPLADALAHLKPDARPRVVTPTHVEFDFDSVYDRDAMFAQATGILPVPRHLLASADRHTLRDHPLNTTNPISNGPWKLLSRTPHTADAPGEITLVPNEAFTGPADERPRLKRVTFRVIPDYAERIKALKAGTVDLVERVLVSDADAIVSSDREVRMHRRGWRNLDYVAWNLVDPSDLHVAAGEGTAGASATPRPHRLFADKDVRRALTAAIDSDRMIRELLTSDVTGEVYGRPAIGTITPALCGAHNDTIQRIAYDPAAAKARLAELGWKDTNGDGWLDKDGQPFRFTLISNADNAQRSRTAALVKADLAAVGIDAQLEQLDAPTFFGRLRTHDFDAALTGYQAGLLPQPGVMWGTDAPFNFTSYHNADVDALVKQGDAEPDATKAKDTWMRLQQIIYDEQPYTFLYWADEIVALDDRFEDVTIDLLAPWRNLSHWHTRDGKVKYAE